MFTPGIGAYAKALLMLLPTAVRGDVILAGGALRCFFDKTEQADVDLFFRSDEDFLRCLEVMHAHPGFRYDGCKGRSEVFIRVVDGIEFNLIGFAFGSPQETIERFDFRCCRMAAWMNGNGGLEFVSDPHAVSDAVIKALIVMVNNGTERTLRRIDHYVLDYGYKLDLDVVDHLTEEADADVLDDLGQVSVVSATPKQRYIARLPRCGNGGY